MPRPRKVSLEQVVETLRGMQEGDEAVDVSVVELRDRLVDEWVRERECGEGSEIRPRELLSTRAVYRALEDLESRGEIERGGTVAGRSIRVVGAGGGS